jgi:hypothetical protein
MERKVALRNPQPFVSDKKKVREVTTRVESFFEAPQRCR